jgi:hypothetical protein
VRAVQLREEPVGQLRPLGKAVLDGWWKVVDVIHQTMPLRLGAPSPRRRGLGRPDVASRVRANTTGLRSVTLSARRSHARLLADVLERIAEGGLHPPRPITVGLDEAGAVLRRYAERRVIGKYVLIP